MKKTVIIVASFALLACGPTKPSSNPKPLQETEKVVLLDFPLRNLNLVRHGASRLESGQLEVNVEMENEKNKDIWTDIQVIFRDANGTEIERTSWEPFQFHRRAVSQYKKASMKSGATDYRVLVRNEK